MKKTLLVALSVIGLSLATLAGPFFGVDYANDANLDMYLGVGGEVFSAQIDFNDIDTVDAFLSFGLDAERNKGDVDLSFGVDFVFAPLVLPVVGWGIIDEVGFDLGAEVDLSGLLETTWDVDFYGDLGVVFIGAAPPVVTWGVGFYVEMPWFIPVGVVQ